VSAGQRRDERPDVPCRRRFRPSDECGAWSAASREKVQTRVRCCQRCDVRGRSAAPARFRPATCHKPDGVKAMDERMRQHQPVSVVPASHLPPRRVISRTGTASRPGSGTIFRWCLISVSSAYYRPVLLSAVVRGNRRMWPGVVGVFPCSCSPLSSLYRFSWLPHAAADDVCSPVQKESCNFPIELFMITSADDT
jgi:hypothetical protein